MRTLRTLRYWRYDQTVTDEPLGPSSIIVAATNRKAADERAIDAGAYFGTGRWDAKEGTGDRGFATLAEALGDEQATIVTVK